MTHPYSELQGTPLFDRRMRRSGADAGRQEREEHPSPGGTVAFIKVAGAPVELMQIDRCGGICEQLDGIRVQRIPGSTTRAPRCRDLGVDICPPRVAQNYFIAITCSTN
jgi:hypothetical protein